MATFNYTIDTNPMAQEIGSASRHVAETTKALTAMQTAVVLAEEKAANQVCENLNKGFYALIHSTLSQKIAKLKSEVDSHLIQLKHLQGHLISIKERMEHDYNRITSRYAQLFNGLNINLKHYIFEFDKPAIDFAVREIEKISNRTKYLIATVPVAQIESLTVSQKIVASNVKNHGLNVIRSMTKFLSNMYAQKKLINRILLSIDPAAAHTCLSIPVIISEYNFDRFDNKNVEITIPTIELGKQTHSAICNAVIPKIDNMPWQEETEIDREIKSEFNKILTFSDAPQRVKDTAHKLFSANHYQTVNI